MMTLFFFDDRVMVVADSHRRAEQLAADVGAPFERYSSAHPLAGAAPEMVFRLQVDSIVPMSDEAAIFDKAINLIVAAKDDARLDLRNGMGAAIEVLTKAVGHQLDAAVLRHTGQAEAVTPRGMVLETRVGLYLIRTEPTVDASRFTYETRVTRDRDDEIRDVERYTAMDRAKSGHSAMAMKWGAIADLEVRTFGS